MPDGHDCYIFSICIFIFGVGLGVHEIGSSNCSMGPLNSLKRNQEAFGRSARASGVDVKRGNQARGE
jgi:hypothetical protein